MNPSPDTALSLTRACGAWHWGQLHSLSHLELAGSFSAFQPYRSQFPFPEIWVTDRSRGPASEEHHYLPFSPSVLSSRLVTGAQRRGTAGPGRGKRTLSGAAGAERSGGAGAGRAPGVGAARPGRRRRSRAGRRKVAVQYNVAAAARRRRPRRAECAGLDEVPHSPFVCNS